MADEEIMLMTQVPCPKCHGSGKNAKGTACKKCQGAGKLVRELAVPELVDKVVAEFRKRGI